MGARSGQAVPSLPPSINIFMKGEKPRDLFLGYEVFVKHKKRKALILLSDVMEYSPCMHQRSTPLACTNVLHSAPSARSRCTFHL